MSVKIRLIAVVLSLLLPALALARWSVASGEVRAPEFPTQVDSWLRTQDETLAADVLEQIEPDFYVMRRYESEQHTPIWLYVGLYAGRAGSGKGAHHPEACYPAAGWEILDSKAISFTLNDGGTLHAQQLEFHQGNAREMVLYWFQPAERWPVGAAGEQLLRVMDALRGRPQYAFVRLSARLGGADNGATARDIEAFAAHAAPQIRRAVEQLR